MPTLVCGTCNEWLEGKREIAEHATVTGHSVFRPLLVSDYEDPDRGYTVILTYSAVPGAHNGGTSTLYRRSRRSARAYVDRAVAREKHLLRWKILASNGHVIEEGRP